MISTEFLEGKTSTQMTQVEVWFKWIENVLISGLALFGQPLQDDNQGGVELPAVGSRDGGRGRDFHRQVGRGPSQGNLEPGREGGSHRCGVLTKSTFHIVNSEAGTTYLMGWLHWQNLPRKCPGTASDWNWAESPLSLFSVHLQYVKEFKFSFSAKSTKRYRRLKNWLILG